MCPLSSRLRMKRRPALATVATMTNKALGALRDLCRLHLHAEILVPAMLELLHDIVPSSRNLFDWTDEQGRLVRYFIEGPVDTRIAQLYFDEFHNRREAEAMPSFNTLPEAPAGVRSAEELNHTRFFNSALYHEVWRPQGFHTRLEAVLRGSRQQLLGSLVLYRGPGEARFNRHDEAQLASVLPLLAYALEACGTARADDRHVPSPEPPQTLVLTLQGQLCHASAGAMRLLMLADGGITREALQRPPQALAGRLLQMLMARLLDQSRLGPAAMLAPPPSITHENGFGQFVLSGQLLSAIGPAEAVVHDASPLPNALAQVTVTRLEPHRVALERVLRKLPITAGQRAVVRELYHGRGQAEVASALGVAPATVVDHVRKVYRSLQLNSVLELRALLDRQIG